MNRVNIKMILAIVLLLLLTSACSDKADKEIVVAEQYGLAYAPIVIMREQGFLEEALDDGYTIRWEKLANTAAIREAMLSDHLDVGFMGIPPFLIGVDQGMSWKIISGLSSSPLGLMTNNPEVKSIEDLVGQGKIALPQPGSIQHILLSMAAKSATNDPKYFDDQLISMKHPEGYQALMTTEDVVAHFTSPPYIFQEMDESNLTLLLSGEEAFGGEFSFIVGACRESFYDDQEAYKAFELALTRSLAFMKDHKEETAQILSEVYDLPQEVATDYVYDRGIKYGLEVQGLQGFIDFMYEAGYIESDYEENTVQW